MSVRRIITIDNGGSQLRRISGFFSNQDAEKRSIVTMEKIIKTVDREGFRVKDNLGPYDVIDVVKAPKQEYEKMYVSGVGYYMYDGNSLLMSNQDKKTSSYAWYAQIIMAIATDAMMAVKDEEELLKKLDSEESDNQREIDTDFIYTMCTLIPVLEHSGREDCASLLKDNFEGKYEVEFPVIKEGINKISFTLSRDKIGVLPEGVVAMTTIKGEVEPNDYTLVIDIGHVTTDLSLCKGKNLIGSAVVSSPFAGGTLIKLAINELRNFGYSVDEDHAIEALNTYNFRIGTKVIDVSKSMRKVKENFISNYIKNEVLNQLDLAGISAKNIQYIIPIGLPLNMRDPQSNVADLLDLLIKTCGFEDAQVKIDEDCRFTNVKCADTFCRVFAKKV